MRPSIRTASSIEDESYKFLASENRVDRSDQESLDRLLAASQLLRRLRSEQLQAIQVQAADMGIELNDEISFEIVIRTTAVGHD